MDNFITKIIDKDLENGKYNEIFTRFPPEPNGHLHLGHAKAIALNFGVAKKYGGSCNLRLDDTNPTTESEEYVASIIEDIEWLGFVPKYVSYASDYFLKLYNAAMKLLEEGKAYACDIPDHVFARNYRIEGKPGINPPTRNRSIEENLNIFKSMKHGTYDNGKMVIRAKIDMTSPNPNMRDPVLYRIIKKDHHRTAGEWCIYPSYDFAHPLCDAYEGITHSLCTLEFEDHNPLYRWVLDNVGVEHKPTQIEFARLNLDEGILSKRKIETIIKDDNLSGWDDPKLFTIKGLKSRGVEPKHIAEFCEEIGIAKMHSTIEVSKFDRIIREDFKKSLPRVMCVFEPLPVVITDIKEGEEINVTIENNPDNPDLGNRELSLTRNLYIEKSDFFNSNDKDFYRLKPGGEVRLKGACILKYESHDEDVNGNAIKVYCTHDLDTTKKVKATIHWVPENGKRTRIECGDMYTGIVEHNIMPDRVQLLRKGFFKVVRGLVGSIGFRHIVGLRGK